MITKNIIYTLRKDVTTQKLKGKNIGQSFEILSSFLINCTTSTPEEASGISLTAFSAYDDTEDPEIGKNNVVNIEKLFGKGETEPVSYEYPSGEPSSQTETEWHIENKDIKKALDYLIQSQPWPKYALGPVDLDISYDFKFINPDSREVLPNQLRDSMIMVWLSRSCSCSPTLYFPFPEANSFFDEYINKIEPYLSFKFERKHLRIVTENTDKGTYVFRKI